MPKRSFRNKRIREGQKLKRQRATRRWWHTTRRRTALIGTIACVSYALIAVVWFAHMGGFSRTYHAGADHFYRATAQLGFRVAYVYVEGRHDTPLAEVTQAIGVKQNEPILAVSVDDVRDRLAALPRVRVAVVERVLPNELYVRIEERAPIAVWQYQGKLALVDAEGRVMPEEHIEKYASLPLVVGENAPAHTAELLAFLEAEPTLMPSIKAAVMIGARRWDIRFASGLRLKLPESHPEEAWHAFADLDRRQNIMKRDITVVDMRIEDRVFIKAAAPRPPVPDASAPSRET